MKYLKYRGKTGLFVSIIVALLLTFAGCGGNEKPPTPPPVSISIAPLSLNIRIGETNSLTVTTQNTDFTLSVSPSSGSGCARSGSSNTIICTPTAANTYTVTVRATTAPSPSANATVTVSAAPQPDFTNISYSDTGSTALYGINNSGQAVGEFYDSAVNIKAFQYNGGSSYTFLSPPNAGDRVLVYGINNAGAILGWSQNGYFRKTGTTYTVLGDYTGARFTDYTGISNTKTVGYFTNASGYSSGFIKTGDTFTGAVTVNHPSASSASCRANWTCGTMLTGINDAGHVTGVYTDTDGYYRGFVYKDGGFTPVDHPDRSSSNKINTWVTGINGSGVVVGYFWSSDSRDHGFVKNGTVFTVIDHPSAAASGEGTHIYGINDSGRMAGWYDDGTKATGFLLSN